MNVGSETQRKIQAKEHGRDSEVKKNRKFAEAELGRHHNRKKRGRQTLQKNVSLRE